MYVHLVFSENVQACLLLVVSSGFDFMIFLSCGARVLIAAEARFGFARTFHRSTE